MPLGPQSPDTGFFTQTTFDVAAAAEDTFIIEFPWLDDAHLSAKDQAGAALTISTVTHDRDTGETTVVLSAASGGSAGNEVVIFRETPVPADFNDFIKRDVDGDHASSLHMGIQPSNLKLLYILQDMTDRMEAGAI